MFAEMPDICTSTSLKLENATVVDVLSMRS
jgi:hypothetical protein